MLVNIDMTYKIPKEILKITEELEKKGHEAYLVGGCVRDLLRITIHGELVEPKDWDITTNAVPEEIQKIFPESFYENDFGTVGVLSGSEEPSLKVVEITPYRLEEKYSDKRHPDAVKFSKKLEDDLKRRDFTINAIALRLSSGQALEIVDLFEGQKDLKEKIIRTVGDPGERFDEDALRIMRAVRLATELNFSIEKETQESLTRNRGLLEMIAKERIRDEFSKILMSADPVSGIRQLQKLGILKYVVPELEEGVGVTQNKEHIYTVWEHNLRSLGHAVEKNFSLEIRMAALLHDVGKPRMKMGEGHGSTFYNHETAGAKMALQMLSRLRYPKKFIEKVVKLVRWHLFFSDTDVITLSAVRRLLRNVGTENIWDLMSVRFCDRIGMGRPKEEPYRLRKYESMIEEALRDPISVSQLKIDGEKVMKIAKINPGPKVGYILHALLEEVLDDPSLNNEDYLLKRVVEFSKMPEGELEKMGVVGKKRREEEEQREIGQIRKKYGVK